MRFVSQQLFIILVLFPAGVLSDILDYVLTQANAIERSPTPDPDMEDSPRSKTAVVSCCSYTLLL